MLEKSAAITSSRAGVERMMASDRTAKSRTGASRAPQFGSTGSVDRPAEAATRSHWFASGESVRRSPTGRLVSVILPTHTGGRLFEQALASALSQTWRELEVLVVDNGAGLNRTAVEGFDPRVTVLVEETPGISQARNRALAVARGDYIAFLDHDDLWRPEKVARQVAALEAAPLAILAHTGGVIVDAEGREIGTHPTSRLSLERLRRFRADYIFSSVVVRRDAAGSIGGFRRELCYAQDIDYLLRLLELGPASYLPECLVSYRWHSASTSQALTRRRIAAGECLQIAAQQRALARLRCEPRAYVDAWVGTAIVRSNAARDALYLCDDRRTRRDWAGAARALGSAIGFNPAVPAWVGLKSLGRGLQRAGSRRANRRVVSRATGCGEGGRSSCK